MPRAHEFQELLFADVALLEGHATARQVAAALLKYWDRRERMETTLAEELALLAGITGEELAKLEAQVAALVAKADGDAQLAVTRRGGLSHDLHTAVSRQDPEASRQLTGLGAGIRVQLRNLPKDRYLDYMPVGEGGMGIVYWALDTELGRQVAFKVVRPPAAGPGAGVTPPAPVRMRAPDGGSESAEAFEELKARFLQEAWVTGGMEHPGIVPVYELGRTEGGVPYYTMRFVRGQRTLETAIAEVSERELDDRLALLEPFLKICDAISYAHSRGVVHRDLKPANVALGDYGEAIVLDWGLAKLGGRPDVHASRWQAHVAEFRDTTDMATMTSALGTPGYMAPEAAAGDVANVDMLSDVYSLGVILFEIVTGQRPFEVDTFAAYAARLQSETAPDARSVDPAAPPALAELCAGALAQERRMRPATVAALAEGVRTWQTQRALDREIDVLLAEAEGTLIETEGMTVISMRMQSERAAAACQRVLDLRPGSERARSLLDRARQLGDAGVRAQTEQAHKALLRRVGLGALIVVALLGAGVAWLLDQRRQEAESAREVARHERDMAALHRTRAEEAMGFITDELRAALEPEGRLDVLTQIGERARAHFAAIPLEEESAKGFRQRMRALRQLGEVYLAQGNLPRARAVFEEAVSAGDVYAARDSTSRLAQFESGRARINLAYVDHAQGYPRRGRKRAAGIVEGLAGPRISEVDRLEWDEARIRALSVLSRALRGMSEHERAREASEQAQALVRGLLDDEGAGIVHRKLAIDIALRTASTRFDGGDPEGALTLARDARSDAQQLRGSRPDDLTVQIMVLRATHLVAWILRYSGRFEAAEGLLTPALPEARKLVAQRPDNYQWRALLMNMLFLLGDARAGQKQQTWKAADVFKECFELAESLQAHDPSHAGWTMMLVNLCDRRVSALGPDPAAAPEARLALRKRAAEYARALSDLEPGNVRWRYLLAFTLGTLARLTPDARERIALARESRGHNRYALERLPGPVDINDFYVQMSIFLISSEPQPSARIAVAQATFDTLEAVARKHPEAYYPHAYLVRAVDAMVPLLREREPDAARESDRQIGRAITYLSELADRADDVHPRIAADLDAWTRQLKALQTD